MYNELRKKRNCGLKVKLHSAGCIFSLLVVRYKNYFDAGDVTVPPVCLSRSIIMFMLKDLFRSTDNKQRQAYTDAKDSMACRNGGRNSTVTNM